MSQLISARLPDNTAERLKHYAKKKQRSLNEVTTYIFEEWLRQEDFRDIEFRDTAEGTRRAYMKNSRLAVSWIIHVAKGYAMDKEKLFAHFTERPKEWVQAALNYYEAFPKEIDAEIELMQSEASFNRLKRLFPNLQPATVTDADITQAKSNAA
jgi:uncharacterized protein (DUF433 family)